MISAGIDIGSTTTKVVLFQDKNIIGKQIQPTGWKPVKAAEAVYTKVLQKFGIQKTDVSKVIATGYGRVMLPFADEQITEITCHARGAYFTAPSIRTIIDIGGQDSKVIRLDQFGLVEDFVMNDRCAAGTGKYLEFMAHTLNIPVADFGKQALDSQSPAIISSMCTVFSESEVLSLLAENIPVPDVISGIHLAIAKRIAGLVDSVGCDEVVSLTGGVAKNPGIKHQLQQLLKVDILIPDEPDFMGALGAALSV